MTKKTLGIIGGGQLGMFICIAAKRIGLRTVVYSQESDFSAKISVIIFRRHSKKSKY